ncbi:hypothetical protein AAFC00_006481 [Neodothiora populina]|uniref:Uncharacterized protein n=1 Tax=Neodothiora populina TaxID=2781224 RepID=A0ABR3P5D3_9PEZI
MLHQENSLPGKYRVNACCPGLNRTNFCSYDDRAGLDEEGTTEAIRLATLGNDGEFGTFSNKDGPIPW